MKIRLSVNRHIVGKDISAIARHNDGFLNMTLTLDEVAGVFQLGWAVAHVLKGARRTENVVSAGFLAVDVDGGLTIQEALADPFTQAYAGLLYTTASHTPKAPRFRIFFPLEAALTDRDEIRLAQVGISMRYGGDLAATDAPRLFAGNEDCCVEMIGKALPAAEVEKLIQLGREKVQVRRLGTTTSVRGSVRSRISIPVDAMVRTATGQERFLWDLPPRTRVYCPNHTDRRPSAFTVLSSGNKPGVFCSACQITMFPDGEQIVPEIPYSAASVPALLAAAGESKGDDPLSVFATARVNNVSQRFLENVFTWPEVVPSRPRFGSILPELANVGPTPGLWVESDVVCVVSGKGTGKTHALKEYITELLRLRASVLLLGSRRVLLAEQSFKLGLTNYIREDGVTFNSPSQGYAVCIDSLPRLKPGEHHYDVVVIDECQSVFEHLQSDTLKKNRRTVLQYLRYHLRHAKQILLLDADLGRLTLEMTGEMLKGLKRSTSFLQNDWKPTGRIINVYEDAHSPRQLISDLFDALRQGQRCMVCCNSKADAEVIATEAQRAVSARNLRVMCITAANSGEPDIQQFIREIRTRMHDYDLVVVSPSMSSGVDITFPDEASLFRVFGIFHPLITTHFEIDQQLGRIRQPIDVNVWVSPEEFSFEADPGVIQAEIWASEADHYAWLGTSDDGADMYHADPLADLSYVAVAAHRRASLNSLRKNFLEYKERGGWEVNVIPLELERARAGSIILREGKASHRADQHQRIIAAPKISADEYRELHLQRKFKQLPAGADEQMRRYEVESFYDMEVSEQLLSFDDGGRGRKAVKNMLALIATEAEIRTLEERDLSRPEAERGRWRHKREVLTRLLTAAGLLHGDVLRTDVEVNLSRLGAFLRALEAEHMKAALQRLFDLAPRKDGARKPVRQLSEVLKVLGLRLKKSSRDRAGGTDQVSFRLDQASLDEVLGHAERRRKRAVHHEPAGDALLA